MHLCAVEASDLPFEGYSLPPMKSTWLGESGVVCIALVLVKTRERKTNFQASFISFHTKEEEKATNEATTCFPQEHCGISYLQDVCELEFLNYQYFL